MRGMDSRVRGNDADDTCHGGPSGFSVSGGQKNIIFGNCSEYRASPQDSVRHMYMANMILGRPVHVISIPPSFPK
jgi:hypothetical protein